MKQRGIKPWLLLLLEAFAWSAATARVAAGPAFVRELNGPATTWELFEAAVPAHILAQECRPGGARDQKGYERVVIAAPAGESALLTCATPPLAAVDELSIRVWVKSARPDIQVAARLKLPRSRDSQQRPVIALVKGASYRRPGHWQQLVIPDIPKRLAAEVRVLRAAPGAAIDSREAFLESVVIMTPGDPKGIELGIDQLEVDGIAATSFVEQAGSRATAPARPRNSKTTSIVTQAAYEDDRTPAPEKAAPVRLQGTTLMVEGRPFLARAIEWNGEPLQFLAERGFNAVRLNAPPTAEQITDAQRLNLWFICSPPKPDHLAREGIGAPGDRVLAWRLEDDALETDPNYARRWADLVRERDAVYGRPILIAPLSSRSAIGKAADIVIARHPRLGLILPAECERWLTNSARLGRPGTPVWIDLDTEFGPAVRAQANALTHQDTPPPKIEARQLESIVRASCLSGVRGFLFQSASSLSERDAFATARASELELLNRQLQLMEPWLAGGKVASQLTSTTGDVTASVMYVDRARLLVQLERSEPNAASSKTTLPRSRTFIVPGVSESSQVYFLTPVSFRSLSSERIAGGTRIEAPAFDDAFLMITEDPRVVQSLRQHVVRHANQTLQLERDLAVERARTIFRIEQQLAHQQGQKPILSAADATNVNTQLAQLDTLLASRQLELAQQSVTSVNAELERLQTAQRAAFTPAGLESNALTLSYDRIAELASLNKSFENLRGGENLLPAGDFENLGEMTQFGWQHIVGQGTVDTTQAELSPVEPRHGSYSLELKATPPVNAAPDSLLDPLVWIVSPGIPVAAGKIVEIAGWVRVDQPFKEGAGGLAIIDTLGGPELSLIVRETSGWQAFRMIRAVPETTELRLTFALNAFGSAKVDAVMVRTLDEPLARRLPSISNESSTASTAEAIAPVTRLPQTR